jgi:hypothetical protein
VVTAAKAWPTGEPARSKDISTSMGELRPKGGELSPKPAALSFQDQRVRLEWP